MVRIMGIIAMLALGLGFGAVKAENMSIQAKVVGVGINVEIVNGSFMIKGLVPGAPAEKSGLIRAGDELTAVKSLPTTEWVNIKGMTMEAVAPLIRGAVGTQVGLRIMRGGATTEINLTRAEFEAQ